MVEMLVDGPASAVNTLSRKWAEDLKKNKATFEHGHCGLEFTEVKKVQTTTLEDLISKYGAPFFVKIDVEGHELSALRGLHRPVPYISFETNLPEFRTEGVECISVLQKLAPAGRFNYMSECVRGLRLEDWVSAEEMCAVLGQCTERSIEIFWKSSLV
jgi:hypothetical protein